MALEAPEKAPAETLRGMPASRVLSDIDVMKRIVQAFNTGGGSDHRFIHIFLVSGTPQADALWSLPEGVTPTEAILKIPLREILSRLLAYPPPTTCFTWGKVGEDRSLPERWRAEVNSRMLLLADGMERLSAPARAALLADDGAVGAVMEAWELEGTRRIREIFSLE